ncbi:MAG: hypothetical protein WCP03_00290 [Candidatus Saccharibacteria bacterium]
MKKTEKTKQKTKNKYLVPILIALVVILAVSTTYFGWQYKQLKDEKNQAQSQVEALNKQVSSFLKGLVDKTSPAPTPTPTITPVITKSMKDNISAAISSKNTAALEGYMAPSVNVILAASEGIGPQTPAQAINDLAYLNSATSPWDFSLPASTIAKYSSSPYYGKYFASNTIVGESANKYVVSFGVNSSGKIDTIFMAVNSDLL